MPGPGILFQHDASRHGWLPTLGGQQYVLLTQDDYPRRVLGALLVPRETSWHPSPGGPQTVFTYGRPLAYYVDHHSIFRWVTHQSYRYTVTTAEDDARVHLETGEIPTRRWEEAIATARGRQGPLPADVNVADLFSLHLERTVGKDGTFPFLGQRWPLDRMLHHHRVQLR